MQKAFKKTITWRCICLVTTGLVGYAITGSATIGAAISITYNVIMSVLYWLHEKFWGN